MKKYIKPSLTIFQVNTQGCIMQQASAISVTSTSVTSENLAAGEYEELIDE